MSVNVELVFLSFLESYDCENKEYVEELSLLMQRVHSRALECDGVLQMDGNISAKKTESAQTDGFVQMMPSTTFAGYREPDVDEDLCHRIGAELATLGDQFDSKINKEVVDKLVAELLNNSLTEESLSKEIQNMLGNLPSGLEHEKATAVIAMTLTRKVATNVPALLGRFFQTTSGFLQRNCRAYFQNMTHQR